MKEFGSVSSKRFITGRQDTRNNWIVVVLVSKYRFNVFGKQSTIDACTEGLGELENFGFKIGKLGYGGTHLHITVDVPKKYSVQDTIGMLKSHSAQNIFTKKPNFRKRYPRNEFWSGYEYHESFGKDKESVDRYIENQAKHHEVKVIDDTQKSLVNFLS
ncbi:MAG: IS200/IS605 family transposase [Candidatus Aenigmatarchaeota archaeon]